ncbi:family 20 glycosylhydrolase [candidate division KSB1 bacterium]|nr:family 20 glycosylhydrolase [candidate division KSB1 bacterium]
MQRTFISLFCLFIVILTGMMAMAMGNMTGLKLQIIPKPVHCEWRRGCFTFNRATRIVVPDDTSVKSIAEYMADLFAPAMGWRMAIQNAPGIDKSDNAIIFSLGPMPGLNEEAYELEVTTSAIMLSASTPAGLFHAVQSLRQLLPADIERTDKVDTAWSVPALFIRDQPRFRWRGLLLDCCRHFMDVEFVKRYIDLLALYKMNVLHWHLTEDQGWRIEIKKYPRLTEIGAWRTYDNDSTYGGFYTQEQIRDVVAYARSRYVNIVPEIEMPGHSLAALSAYPHLSCSGGPFSVETQWGVFEDVYCAGNDSAFQFLQDVLREVIELFPSPYIHIGGDEVPKTRWQQCAKCQTRIKEENLRDEQELQSYFIKRIETFLLSHNRRLIGWDEILEGGLAPEATVQSWRGMEGAIAAAQSGHDAIVSPVTHAYFDYPLQAIDLRRVFAFEPVPEGLTPQQADHIIGGECNMWTERAPQEAVDGKLFPRLLAMAERLWSVAGNGDYIAFLNRVRSHYTRLDHLGVRYGAEAQPVTILPQYQAAQRSYRVQLISGEKDLQIRYTLDGSDPVAQSPLYERPFVISHSLRLKAQAFREELPYGEMAEKSFQLHLAVGKPLKYTYRYSPKYPAGGPGSLVDGMSGSNVFRDGYWQGFEQDDFEAVVDLGKVTPIQAIACNFLQDINSWIFLPVEVGYAVSSDGVHFHNIAMLTHDVPQKAQDALVRNFRDVFLDTSARYVRVFAKNVAICPDWHPGAGGKAWVFVDEIRVE